MGALAVDFADRRNLLGTRIHFEGNPSEGGVVRGLERQREDAYEALKESLRGLSAEEQWALEKKQEEEAEAENAKKGKKGAAAEQPKDDGAAEKPRAQSQSGGGSPKETAEPKEKPPQTDEERNTPFQVAGNDEEGEVATDADGKA